MTEEGEISEEIKIVLTQPLSFEANDSVVGYRAPNTVHRILSLFKNVRLGSDLTRFQLPPLFNLPKSQLQCYGESVYCINTDLLSKCNHAKNPLERFLSVLSWSISIQRPADFGVAPYNPILGETHHVSTGNLNILLEQVSHHHPATALHATNEKENIELIWFQRPVPKFNGASVEIEVQGNRQLKLLNHGETYALNCPNFSIRFFPIPGVEWVGNLTMQCQETGLRAELCYKGSSILGSRKNCRLISGKIFDGSSTSKPLYRIDGYWDKTITLKDINSGNVTVLYNAKEVISGLKAPTVKSIQHVWPTESAVVWSEVSQAILDKDWKKATEAKEAIEQRQRKLLKERNSRGETWVPNHFIVSRNKDGTWNCSPIEKFVPTAPIIMPI